MPKFTGYDSEIDFFTFKYEFTNRVEQRVRKQHLADYLKHNYLGGDTLKLVPVKRVLWECKIVIAEQTVVYRKNWWFRSM